MSTAWIFKHSRSFFSIQYFWNVHDMICQAAILCSCFKRSLTLLAWLCSCGRCPQRSFSFSSSHSAWPFPKLGATNSAIWLPSWAKSVKLKVTHRLFFGLVLFGWLVVFCYCCCFVWVGFFGFLFLFVCFFASLPRKLIDFPQADCSRACFLLHNLFSGAQWNHLIFDLSREQERNWKRLLGPILAGAQEPGRCSNHSSPDVTKHQQCLLFMKWRNRNI